MHIVLHKVFPGILQVIISNGMVVTQNKPELVREFLGSLRMSLRHWNTFSVPKCWWRTCGVT